MSTLCHVVSKQSPPAGIYVCALAQVNIERLIADHRHLLSPAEQSRSAGMSSDKVRQRFMLARIALRRLLADAAGVVPAALQIDIDAQGKPCLASHPGLEFNLSHSANYIAIAITQGVKVGVDVECLRRRDNIAEIARRFFSAAEYQYLQHSGFAPADFYTLWTLKEAYVKALGVGLAKSLSSCSFDLTAAIKLTDDHPEAHTAAFASYQLTLDDQLSVCTLAAAPSPLALYAIDAELALAPLVPLSSRSSVT
jgi:4'-phosphopantetheinyl transferase